MIIKSFELNKIDRKKNKIFLFYGENQGLKNQIIENNYKSKYLKNTFYYDENEVLKNSDDFLNNILSKSFFENEKLIIINRATDKLIEIIDEIVNKEIDDLVLILNSGALDKKSKIRSFFEKKKEIICVPFYEDNNQTLSAIVNKFFRENKIPISQQSMNLIVNRCRGDRQNLNNELNKIESFVAGKKKIEISEILKITNLAENYSVSELVDNCLAKNKTKTLSILSENNYSADDCIVIIRTMLTKSKRLLRIIREIKTTNDIDSAISSIKPPVFWKDKQIVKNQIQKWSYKNIQQLIFNINDIELLIKKNSLISLNILSDFIIAQTATTSN
jgi:DNA polymerase III subunit delta